MTTLATRAGIVMTLGDLVLAEEALTRLLEVKVPARLAYHVAKLTRLVKAETAHFYTARDSEIRELGLESIERPGEFRVREEHMPLYMRRLSELAAVETTIEWTALPLAELPEITAADLLRLGPLVEDRGAVP
jgi:hypothetical protein